MGDKATKKATGGGLHQLTEIDTEEVSLVDAGANGRKLLIVKSKDQENQMATRGAAVTTDGQGNNTAVNKDAAAGGTEAAKVMKLSAPNKELLAKQLGDALAVLTKAKADVDAAEVVTTGGEVPAEFAEQLGPVAVQMAKMAPTAVEKAGYKQFTPERMAQIQGAAETLQGLLTGVAPPPKVDPAPAAPQQAAPAVDVDKLAEQVTKSVSTALGAGFDAVAGGIENITKAVNAQGAKLVLMEKARGSTNAGSSDAPPPRRKVEKNKDASWPKDLGKAHREKQAAGK